MADLRAQALEEVWGMLSPPSGTAVAKPKSRAPGKKGSAETPKITSLVADRIIRSGVPSQVVARMGDVLGVGKGAVAEIVGLDRGTAARQAARNQHLPPHAAEGVVRLLELDQLAVDTFETEAEASGWLRRPHPMLEHETPLECARSSYGAQRVKDILVAIKYGGAL